MAFVMEAMAKMESAATGAPDESRVPNAPEYRTVRSPATMAAAAGIRRRAIPARNVSSTLAAPPGGPQATLPGRPEVQPGD
jgi:hypothetical protein